MSGNAVELQNLSHRYAAHWALHRVSFAATAGDCVAVFGPNGCGKSTLLKILATLLTPAVGGGQILGNDLRKDPAQIRRRLCWLGHDLGLYKALSAGENLKIAAALRGGTLPAAKVEEVLERVGLTGLKHKRVDSFSTGMRKRLALAKILSTPCDLILLDEPHANLDRIGKVLMNKLIAEWRREKITLFLASHDHPEVIPLCDKALVLNEGRAAWFGEAKKIPSDATL